MDNNEEQIQLWDNNGPKIFMPLVESFIRIHETFLGIKVDGNESIKK